MSVRRARSSLILGLFLVGVPSMLFGGTPTKRGLNMGKGSSVSRATFSPAGDLLAIACSEPGNSSEIRLYLVAKRELAGKLTGHKAPITCLQFSPNGKTLVAGSQDGDCLVWDIGARKLVGSLKGHTDAITSVSVSPDGRQIVTTSLDKRIVIRDLERLKQSASLSTVAKTEGVAVYFPDGKRVVSAGHDKIVRIWDLDSKKELWKFDAGSDEVGAVAVTHGGKRLVTVGVGGTIKLWDLFWDVKTGNDVATWSLGQDKPTSFDVRGDGRWVAIGTWSGQVVLYATSMKATVAELKLNAHEFLVSTVAFHPNGKTLATGSALDSTVWLWTDLPD